MSLDSSIVAKESEIEVIFNRIERIVRWSDTFRLVFLRCDSPTQEHGLRRQLAYRLDALRILEITLDKPITSLLDEVTARWDENHPPAAVSVSGLANSLVEMGKDSPALGRLNHDRELLRQKIPASLLIWLPDDALNDMAQGAPDFWAWRSALLEFPNSVTKPATGAPKVFISSTVADLKEYRDKAKAAAIRAGFLPIMNEDWSAKDAPPFTECMARVDGTHLTVALVAYRYGWVPEGQAGDKSITRLECERTVEGSTPKQLLVFVADEAASWPDEKKEAYRLTEAALQGKFDQIPALGQEVQRNTAALQDFKTWLTQGRIRNTFQTPEELERKVESAMKDWLTDHPNFAGEAQALAKAQANPERYLGYWYEFCAYIDIRGLHVGSGRAHRFPIEDLYIELDTAGGGKLKNTLAHPRRVVVGDPGSGKTTFLRWIVHLLAGDRLGVSDHAAKDLLGLSRPLMPVFVSIAEWLEYVYTVREQKQGPPMPKDPQWLVHFLAAQSESREWGLDAEWFKDRLNAGECLLLFDGLDEAPDRKAREFATHLLEAVAATWKKCPILVTSRPSGYEDRAVLPNFEPSHIEALNDHAVETFLDRWSRALHPSDARAAQDHRQELLHALNARPNIRRLARNTVMLTALAVVHWNEKRLPEQRAELYESILLWLARAREQRPGRAGAERSLEVLRLLALQMQKAEGGRKIQVTRHWAAEQIAGLFQGDQTKAEKFLEEEELDSGIIVRRGNEVRFWHLSFQEYLAARAIGGLNEERQKELLLGTPKRLYEPEWREVGQLLGGVLYEQGREKVDGLVTAVLNELLPSVGANSFAEAPVGANSFAETPVGANSFASGEGHGRINSPLQEGSHVGGSKQATLAGLARAVGFLGGIVRDLSPFKYEPGDIHYRQALDAVMGIFTKEGSESVPVKLRIEVAEALGQAGDPRLADDSPRWVAIPGGTFLMGAQKQDPNAPNYDPQARDDETPQEVTLDGFELGRYPVTVQEYAVFMDDDGYAEKHWWPNRFGKWQEPEQWQEQSVHLNRPVVGVSWFESMAYCAWLTYHLHRAGKLDKAQVIRLPTEAEWEFAAQGKTARRYAWGNEEPTAERANFSGNVGEPTPVGVYPNGATPEGVLDMTGNVWEWCLNLRTNKVPEQGNIGTGQGARTARGGSWDNHSDILRCAFRWNPPYFRNNIIGLRLALGSPW
ncbi:MAG: SUMF1/EgtB/PvdO family nonheme iron enzyme [Candidatus Methylumidiphilus sp.]